VRSIAVDTGPLVAWIDSNDRHAERCVSWLHTHGRASRCYTTLACVTEATHLLESIDHQLALLALLARRAVEIVDIGAEDVTDIGARMARYHDVPMDFADATILWLADRLGTRSILTVDERGFATFRLAGGKAPALELQRLG